MLWLEGCFMGIREEYFIGLWPLWGEKEEVALGFHSWVLGGCPFTVLDPCGICMWGVICLPSMSAFLLMR